MRPLLPFVLLAALALSSTIARADPEFGAFWHDGKAELDGYRYTVSRYGHPRAGRAAMVFVTEPFSASRHVKLDDPSKNPGDAVDVLKLNLVRQFQTGIYDYATELSLFVRTGDSAPLKVAFSSSEWCGQVYEEQILDGGKLEDRLASYFEGESATTSEPVPAGGLLEDDLFVALRGLRGDFLRAGETRTVPFLDGAFYRRLAHRKLAWESATLQRLAKDETVRVPAGAIASHVFVVKPSDGRVGRFEIEAAYPHRVVRWSWTAAPGASPMMGGTDGGELTGTARLEYWKLHDPGDEKYLHQLGLKPHE